MDDPVKRAWEKFLNPVELRHNIIEASIFSMAYELLKQCTINRIREFYTIGFTGTEDLISPSYKQKVLSLDRNHLSASLKWLRASDAINDEDLEKFDSVRQCRNTLIHEMPQYVSSNLEIDIEINFTALIELISKIERWWIFSFDLDLAPATVDKDSITPGNILFIQMLAEIALGKEESAELLYKNFQAELLKKKSQ